MAGAGGARPEKPCNLVQHGKFGCLVQRSPNVVAMTSSTGFDSYTSDKRTRTAIGVRHSF